LIIKIELDNQTWVETHELQESTHESKKNQKNKTKKSMSFLSMRDKSSEIHNPISFEEFASKNATIYLHIYIFLHVRKKVAWKSSASYGIIVNLFNYSKPTPKLRRKGEERST
jgi:hypothetical protein